jgi:hypothetical protein
MPAPEHVAWMEQWRSAARALEEDWRARLAALSDEEALAMSEAVLSLATPVPLDSPRQRTSGLVEQQALFCRLGR